MLELSRGEGVMRRARYELLRGAGMLAFHQALAATIAAEFVRADALRPVARRRNRTATVRPVAWLDAARWPNPDETEAEMSFGASTHRITLTARANVTAAVEALAGDVQRLVQGARPAGLAVQLCMSHRVAGLPGLVDAPRDAARLRGRTPCRGARPRWQRWLRANRSSGRPRRIALVHRLPSVQAAGTGDAQSATLALVPAEAVPTHVLFRGRAWPITAAAADARLVARQGVAPAQPAGGHCRPVEIPLHGRATGRAGNRRGSQHLRHVRQRRTRRWPRGTARRRRAAAGRAQA